LHRWQERSTPVIDLATVTPEQFERWAARPFLVHLSTGDRLPATVAEVSRLRMRGTDRPPFSVLFTAPLDVPLAQCVHRLEHPDAGIVEIFLVPQVPRDGQARYEAVFA
jgi:hypothetical protein